MLSRVDFVIYTFYFGAGGVVVSFSAFYAGGRGSIPISTSPREVR